MIELEHELRRVVEGDVRFDAFSRLLYSTDASMYQVEPIGAVIPRRPVEQLGRQVAHLPHHFAGT